MFLARGPEWHLDRTRFDAMLSARFLVDANGSAAIATRFCDARDVAFDHLIRFGRFFKDDSNGDPRTIVEAFAEGWWYTASLPGQRRFVACMTTASPATARRASIHCRRRESRKRCAPASSRRTIGDTRRLRRYQRVIESEFANYLRTRAQVYHDERRVAAERVLERALTSLTNRQER